MNYRLQDIMKLIIPGLYLLALALVYVLCYSGFKLDTSILKDLSAIVVVLIPFVGFVLGYFVECISAFLEHAWYFFGWRRPSKSILKGMEAYPVNGIEKVKTKHGLTTEKFKNKQANLVLQTAKQSLPDISNVEQYRLNAVMARNIFGSQLIFTAIYALLIDSFYKNLIWYISIIISIVFMCYWIHHNRVYVKYVLVEYAKTLS